MDHNDYDMPPLPTPVGHLGSEPVFTADQMRQYAFTVAIAFGPAGEVTEADIAWAKRVIDGANGDRMNARQAKVLGMLRSDPRRDAYEGAATARKGCGLFWVTYSAGERYEPLTRAEVEELAAAGLLVARFPDCYTTPENFAALPNRHPRRYARAALARGIVTREGQDPQGLGGEAIEPGRDSGAPESASPKDPRANTGDKT